MAWFKVDDALHSHMKAMRAGTAAMGLWVLAGSWASDQLTDGWVPEYAIHRWSPGAVELAAKLVSAGFWVVGERDGEPGWRFHEWEEHQPTREEVLARRKNDASRRAAWRDEQKRRRAAVDLSQRDLDKSQRDGSQSESHGDISEVSTRDETRTNADQGISSPIPEKSQCESRDVSHVGSALPDPTRPDPGSSKEEPRSASSRKRPARPLPNDWKPNANHGLYAQENNLDLDHETDQFRNHAEANDRRQASWDAAFRQWIGNAAKWQKSRRQASPGGYQPYRDFSDEEYLDPNIPLRGDT